MASEPDISDKSPSLWQSTQRRRLETLLLTSLAVFALAALVWPLSIKGYHSTANIQLSIEGEAAQQEFLRQDLAPMMQQTLGDVGLTQMIERIPAESGANSSLLMSKQMDWIRQRISVGFKTEANEAGAGLTIRFDGNGTPAEERLVAMLASDIASQLGPQLALNATGHDGAADFDEMARAEHYERVLWMVDQVESGVAAARQQAFQLVQETALDDDNSQLEDSASAFRKVGHTREIREPSFESLKQTLESVDVGSLRRTIRELEPRETPSAKIGSLAKFDQFSVTQEPVGAVPGFDMIMLMVFLSLCVGSVVALNIKPFSETGFESVEQIARDLGVPVVATVGSNESEINELGDVGSDAQPWANQATAMAGTVLFGLALVAVGFWLANPAVREAFGEGPFQGFARIVWIFTGTS